jgi:hypothetical protein
LLFGDKNLFREVNGANACRSASDMHSVPQTMAAGEGGAAIRQKQ